MKQQLVFEAPRRGMPPRHFADLDDDGAIAALGELGLPAFRAKQLANQYFGRLISDPQQMTDLPAAVRGRLAETLFPKLLDVVRSIECDAGETRKTLWRAGDGATFESVLMRYPRRTTVCISSQAGCGMACPFCATGQGGLTRNLSTAEILEQVRTAATVLRADESRLSNIVFMGMGEPVSYTHLRGLKVADATAFSLCMDNRMPILVFNLLTDGNIARAVAGERIGTLVTTQR